MWILVAITGSYAQANLGKYLTTSLDVPGSQSAGANAILTERFGENTEGTFTIVYKYKTSTLAQIEEYKSSIITAASVIPNSVVTIQKAIGGILLSSITTPMSLLEAAQYTDALRVAISDQNLLGAQVTGPPAINHDVSPVLASDLNRGKVVAISLALFLLILILGLSLSVLIPFIFAMASISLALSFIFLLAQKTLMVLYIPNIIELIGLGIAIDYSLLILYRYRRELRENPHSGIDEALTTTMATAGRTVIISGSIVSIALAILLFVPVPFIRSLGAAGLIMPLASMVAAITLLPAMLSLLGHSAVSTRGFRGIFARANDMGGVWAKTARFVIARPKSVFTGALIILAILASSVFWLSTTPSSLTAIPSDLESAHALSMVVNRAGPGVITPHEVVIDLGIENLAQSSSVNLARIKLTNRLLKNPEIFIVATDKMPPFVEATGRYLRFFIIGRHVLGAPESNQLVETLRTINLTDSGFSKNSVLYLGGPPAQGVDLIHAILTSLPWIILLALLMTYVLLMRAFRSIILPLKAIVLDLISVTVAFASLVAVFHFGLASSLLLTYRLDQIEAWVLIFLFVVLFGLSMDYEIFLVARMREARDRGASNNEAIIEGLASTGAVVGAAAIIFVAAVSGLVTGHFAGLQQLGVGLGVGVLIDATIIRGLLLPSAMVLLGRWNWWLPSPVARLLKTKASPLEAPEVRL